MKLIFTVKADEQLNNLENNVSQKRVFKDVTKSLKYMEMNLRHPSLNTHEFKSLKGLNGEKIFEFLVV